MEILTEVPLYAAEPTDLAPPIRPHTRNPRRLCLLSTTTRSAVAAAVWTRVPLTVETLSAATCPTTTVWTNTAAAADASIAVASQTTWEHQAASSQACTAAACGTAPPLHQAPRPWAAVACAKAATRDAARAPTTAAAAATAATRTAIAAAATTATVATAARQTVTARRVLAAPAVRQEATAASAEAKGVSRGSEAVIARMEDDLSASGRGEAMARVVMVEAAAWEMKARDLGGTRGAMATGREALVVDIA